jgi:formate C-acetyltransferase
MEARIHRLYNALKAKISDKREMWSASHLSVFAEEEWKDRPLILRRAKAIELQLSHMPVEITRDDLIAGTIPLGNFWYGTTFPNYAKEEETREAAKYGMGVQSVWGHYVPDYARVLHQGLKGIRTMAMGRLESLDDSPRNRRKRDFLEAVLISNRAVQRLASRYRHLARRLVEAENEPQSREELNRMASILSRVPEEPAAGFREAVQSFWLTFVALHATMNNVPAGRLDYFLWPFLRADLEHGKISLAEAQELIDCLWLKFNERSMFLEPDVDPHDFIMIRQWSLRRPYMALYNYWLQNVMIGGQDGDGHDTTNSLSYMCLEASRKFDLTQPVLSVRFHPETPERLLGLACRLIQTGSGMPSIYNDSVLVEGLETNGFSREEARGYTNDGCWEVTIPGVMEFRWGPVHVLQCLEFALNKGKSRIFGENDTPSLFAPVEGIETGDPKRFTTYEDLWQAFLRQVDHQVDRYMSQSRSLLGKYYKVAPVPFLSSLIAGCLESARDITEGGARYYVNAIMLTGLPNTADSLAAIKILVFEEGRISLPDLLAALAGNFHGQERLRQLLINRSPKYGNDLEDVDQIATKIAEHVVDRIRSCGDAYRPIRFVPGIATFEDYDLFGRMVGATPDGRKAGEGLAPNAGPAPGRDVRGPTALVHSYGKFDHISLVAGSELDVSMNAKDFQGQEGLGHLMSFVKAFLQTGGTILNIALNDVETLKRAQQNPERYKSLRVRMGGWSAYFVLLDKENQDHHIARYSH